LPQAVKIGASAIGKNRRQHREKGHEPAPSYFKNEGAARQLKGTSFATESAPQPEPARPRRRIQGLNDDDFSDPIPF